MDDLISVVVATYNRPDALDAVLRGLSRQSDRNFEIVVADDGSGPETAAVVERWQARAGVAVNHVWHEDRGFRLAEIRNRAIEASAGSLCVFLDGDSIPRGNFVAAHRRLAEPGWFVAGNRVLLSAELTRKILAEGLMPERWTWLDWLKARAQGGVNRIAPLLPLPLGPLRLMQGGRWQAARGGNIAMFKRDLETVDGFDAQFSGWGREDSDIVIRLIRSGVRRKDGRYATAVLHLWHPESERALLPENEARLDALLRSSRVRAVSGLSRLAPEGAPVQASASP